MEKILIFLTVIGLSFAALPSYIKVCKRTDPNLTKCIIDSVTSLRPKLAEGIPELRVPSIEPLPLDEIKLRSGSRSAKIDANITNLLVYGPSSFEILNLKPELEKNRFIFQIRIPHIFFKGDYDIDMNVLILKYKGQGPITGNFTDMNVDVLLRGKVSKINGANHIQFRKFGIGVTIGRSKLVLGNLFSGQGNLGRATNEVINDNSDVFIDEIKPALESSLADKFTQVANIICKTFTYEELFPK